MEAKENRYGIWLSEEEMSMIQNALEWMQNSCCNEIPKIADVKNLRNDLSKIQENGPQIPETVENSDEIYEDDRMKNVCEECE